MYSVSPGLQEAAGIVVPAGMNAFTSLTNLVDVINALSIDKFRDIECDAEKVWEAKRDLFDRRRELFGTFQGTDDLVTTQEGVVRFMASGVPVALRKPSVHIHSATYAPLYHKAVSS